MARHMTTSVVVKYMARYLVVASGENSAENIPIIPGLHGFVGEIIFFFCELHNTSETQILKIDEVTTGTSLSTGTSPTTESTNAVKS
jgi:hypothetical protein